MEDLAGEAGAALLGILLAIPLARRRDAVWIAVCLLIGATTVAREPFGLPFEADAFAVPLLGGVLLLRHRSALAARTFRPFLALTLTYLAANVLATLLSSPLTVAAVRQCVILGFRVATFYLVVAAIQVLGDRRRAVPYVLLVVAAVQAATSFGALAILPLIETPLVRVGLHGPDIVSLSGFFQEPNLFAAFLAGTLGLALPLAVTDRPLVPRWLLAVAAVAVAPALVVTYTRSAWLASVVVTVAFLGFLVIYQRARLARAFKVTGMLAALVLLTVAATDLSAGGGAGDTPRPARSPVVQRLDTAIHPGETAATAHRLEIWREAIEHWQQRPVVGHGPLSLHRHDNGGWLYSSIVQAAHDSGTIGLVSMLAFLVAVASLTWRRSRASVGAADRVILLGYLLAQLALFVTSQFSSFFWGALTWVLLGLATGHALAAGANPVSGREAKGVADGSRARA